MRPPTIPADPRLRTRLIVWGTCTLVIGAVGLLALKAYLNDLAALSPGAPQLAAEKFHHLALLVVAALLVLTAGGAGLCSYLALRILRTRQYPPPGMPVWWETPLRTGRRACGIAFSLWAVAVLVLLCRMGLSMVLWEVAQVPPGAARRPLQTATIAGDSRSRLLSALASGGTDGTPVPRRHHSLLSV
jgi:hypothetical protein